MIHEFYEKAPTDTYCKQYLYHVTKQDRIFGYIPSLDAHFIQKMSVRENVTDNNFHSVGVFLDTQVSLAPTHVSPLVGASVGDTFEFPLLLNISVQQSSLMTPPSKKKRKKERERV